MILNDLYARKLMEVLKPSEYIILIYIITGCRIARMKGEDKFSASYKEILKGCGITGNTLLSSTLKKLSGMGLITHETHFIGGKRKTMSEFTSILASDKAGSYKGENTLQEKVESLPKPNKKKREFSINDNFNCFFDDSPESEEVVPDIEERSSCQEGYMKYDEELDGYLEKILPGEKF